NLNLASFLNNYELDVAIEDAGIAGEMEAMYERDLENATEIRLARNRVVTVAAPAEVPASERASEGGERASGAAIAGLRPGGGGRARSGAAAGAIRVANAVGAAVTNHRVIGQAEARLLMASGLGLLVIAIVAVLWPRVLAVPLSALALWVGLALIW